MRAEETVGFRISGETVRARERLQRVPCAWVAVRLLAGVATTTAPRALQMPSLVIAFPPFSPPPLRRRSAAKKTKKIDAAKNAKGGGVVGNARGKDMRGGAGAGQVRVKPGTAAAAAAR